MLPLLGRRRALDPSDQVTILHKGGFERSLVGAKLNDTIFM